MGVFMRGAAYFGRWAWLFMFQWEVLRDSGVALSKVLSGCVGQVSHKSVIKASRELMRAGWLGNCFGDI